MTGAEVSHLLIRLTGDASHYLRMINSARFATMDFLSQMSLVGLGLTRTLTVPLVAFAGAASKQFMDFEKQIIKLQTIVGLSRETMVEWSAAVLEMSNQTGRSAEELASALHYIASSGSETSQSLQVLRLAAEASAIGLGDTQTIANAVTTALNAYGAAGLTAAKATDILVAAVKEGKAEATEIARVIPKIVPLAVAMGVSFEEVAGAMAVMSRLGAPAQETVVNLQGMIGTLMKPSAEARELMHEAGLSYVHLRDVLTQPGGVIEAFRILHREFGEDAEKMGVLIPNFRAMRGELNLLIQDERKVKEAMDAVRYASGELEKGTAILQESLTNRFDRAIQTSTNALRVFGESFGEVTLVLVKGLGDSLQTMSHHWVLLPGAIRHTIATLLLLVAATGPVVYLFSALVKWGDALALLFMLRIIPAFKYFTTAGTLGHASLIKFLSAPTTRLVVGITAITAAFVILTGVLDVVLGISRKVNESFTEITETQDRLKDTRQEKAASIFKQATGMEGNNQKRFLEKNIGMLQKDIQGLNQALEREKKNMENILPPGGLFEIISGWFFSDIGKEKQFRMDEIKNALKTAREELKKLQDLQRQVLNAPDKQHDADKEMIKSIEAVSKRLEFEADTVGMTTGEIERYRFALQGATDEQLRMGGLNNAIQYKKEAEAAQKAAKDLEQLMEDGKRIKEEVATDDVKYALKVDELNNLLIKGAISWEIYNRAVDKAYESLFEANKTIRDIRAGIEGVSATSAEGIRAVGNYSRNLLQIQQQARISAVGARGAKRILTEPKLDLDKMEDFRKRELPPTVPGGQIGDNVVLKEIRDILKRGEKKPGFNLEPVGTA